MELVLMETFPLWCRSRLPRVRVLDGPRANAQAHLDDWIDAQAEHPNAPDLTEHAEEDDARCGGEE